MKTTPLLAAALMSASILPALAESDAFIERESPGLWRASRLVGVDVLGPDGRKVGDVTDVLVDRQGQAAAVVVGIGGVLGIGQKQVALPYAALHFTDTPRPAAAAPGVGAPTSAAGLPVEPGMAAGSAVPVETPAAQSSAADAAAPHAALGGPVGTTAGVPGGTVTGLAATPTPGTMAQPGGGTASPRLLDRPDHGTVDMTFDQLKAAPAFTFAR